MNWSLWFTYILLNQLVVYTAAPVHFAVIREGIKPVCKNSSLRFRVPFCTCYSAYTTIKSVIATCYIFICNCITIVYFNIIISYTVFSLLLHLFRNNIFLLPLAFLGARIAHSSQWLHYGLEDRGIRFNYKQEQKIITSFTMSGLALRPTHHPAKMKGNRNQ